MYGNGGGREREGGFLIGFCGIFLEWREGEGRGYLVGPDVVVF